MDAKKIALWAVFILLVAVVLMMAPVIGPKVRPLVSKVPVVGSYTSKVPQL